MSDEETAPPQLSEDARAFVTHVFDTVRAGDTAALAALLDQGLPVSLSDEKGDDLVMMAAYHGHADMVARLIDAGADPDRVNAKGQSPLAGAAFKGDVPVVRMLLEKGAAVDGTGADGRTPLMMATLFDRAAVAELLLEHGADPTRRTSDGASMRDAAVAMGATKTPALLDRALSARQAEL